MAVLVVALAACSDQSADAPPATPPTSTLATPTSTTVAAATTTTIDDEAAVREAHLAFLAMFEVVGDPPDPDHPELARRATGDAYDRLRASLVQAQASGRTLSGGWSSHIESVRVAGSSAVVVDCLLDLGVVRDSRGDVVVDADEHRLRRTTNLIFIDGVWRVSQLNVPAQPDPCGA